MKITLSKIKYNADFSEETHCFKAIVNIDGVPLFAVENEGHGGSNRYGYINQGGMTVIDVDDWCINNLPKQTTNLKNKDGSDFIMPTDLDMVIIDLLNDYLLTKELNRKMRLCWIVSDGESLYKIKKSGKEGQLERVAAKYIVLNSLSPSSCLEMYKQQT